MTTQHFWWCLGDQCVCRRTGYVAGLWTTIFLFAFEVWGWIDSWSFALLGDAWHVLSHVPFYLLAIHAFSRQDKAQYSLAMAVLLICVGMIGIPTASLRAVLPSVLPGEALVFAVVGLSVNIIMLFFAHMGGKSSQKDHVHGGVVTHVIADTGMSVVVVVSILLMLMDIPIVSAISDDAIDAFATYLASFYLIWQGIKMWNESRF